MKYNPTALVVIVVVVAIAVVIVVAVVVAVVVVVELVVAPNDVPMLRHQIGRIFFLGRAKKKGGQDPKQVLDSYEVVLDICTAHN